MQIGVQFYTIRESCKDLDSFSESLKRVADMGFKNVQISGTCAYDPQWLSEELKKNDLKCVLTHIKPDRLLNETEQVAKDHDVFGCDYVGLGVFHFTDEEENQGYDFYMENYPRVAKVLKENGKLFMHHNHHYEFKKIGNKTVLDCLAEAFPADTLGFTLDTHWVQRGGGDPAWWLEHLKGRVPVIHLKDYAFGPQYAVLGEGNINFDRVFEKAEVAGTKYMLIEQDNCYGEDPFDCLQRSYNYLKARGFE